MRDTLRGFREWYRVLSAILAVAGLALVVILDLVRVYTEAIYENTYWSPWVSVVLAVIVLFFFPGMMLVVKDELLGIVERQRERFEE